MRVRILGAAAGGGSPQWNCGCAVCRAVRSGAAPARTQSSVAVSPDGREWFLFNASPDVLGQIAGLPAVTGGRRTPFGAVLLTDAELDHTLGLVLLREAPGLRLFATPAAHKTLTDGSGLLPLLERYCPVSWTPVVPEAEFALGENLSCRAFDVPTTKRDRFGLDPRAPGRVVGYRITSGGAGVVYLPGVQALTPAVLERIRGCDCLLIDGTCWSDDELPRLGLGRKTSREMGHLPVSEGLALVAGLDVPRIVYLHLNNTNPMLLHDSPERGIVTDHGAEVAFDGLELEV
ncbi:pyrroloquinoline quinone biosynthesis protein PqqB [Kineosporia sp. J2-2]|uniref:Coenzyme PQQ synthesis protein B n=1 Tax=Kineosporia corallincola TaxID=2835133 RepID=A0ABS5TRN7_9ACTN|nr:pyrroloquinoline quinone biosynthesis protein PqqB [Kineosporia corallincola]MBT0773461.1 pyrroloquinoline quinone biosynthesis protein PqqB [Kineosporia corallincola]